MNLHELSKQVHEANKKWWQDPATQQPIKRNKGELLALIHSETSEGWEGEQENAQDDKLTHRLMGEVELVDAAIRIFDYAAGFGHDLYAAGIKFGVSEFFNLNHFIDCAMKHCVDGYPNHARMHSKISRVLELERKGKPSAEVADGLMVVLIHIFLYAQRHCYDMQGAYDEKMEYNRTRTDHTHEARTIAGGKQF